MVVIDVSKSAMPYVCRGCGASDDFNCGEDIGLARRSILWTDTVLKASSENRVVIMDLVYCTYLICKGYSETGEIKAGDG